MGCEIYGRETVRYTHNYIDDDSAIQLDTLDWTIVDTLLDGSDNTTVLVDAVNTDTQDKVYETAGLKQVHCEIDIDDGWGNIYQVEADLEVEAKVYEPPVLDYSWTPEEPTILDTVEFTQAHDDTRDMLIPKQYGWIDAVKIDHYNDGTWEEEELTKDALFSKVYETKQDGIEIKLVARYWDGYEMQETELVKSMDMSNIPPVSTYDRADAGQCIPAYVYTATSTDLDDEDTGLTYSWKLYQKQEDLSWLEIDSGIGIEYTYPFQFEGDYKIVLRTTDQEGAWHEKIEEFPIVFDVCGTGTDASCSGVIKLESNRFEMISMPVRGRTVNDYFIAKLEEVTGKPAIESIQFCKAYPSNSVSNGKYVGFIPGTTPIDSYYNFKLVEDDDGTEAHVPFFVRTKELDAPIEISWTTEDEVVE